MSHLTTISFGGGVQSTALLICSALGLHQVPKADVAIFADTGGELPETLAHVAKMAEWAKPYGIKVETVAKGDLIHWAFYRRPHQTQIPNFYRFDDGKRGISGRSCTLDFKLRPIWKRTRQLIGVPHGRVKGWAVDALIGISRDEAHRMKPSGHHWITNKYPLVEAGLTRDDCNELIAAHGIKKPRRSSCFFCPYHDNAYWWDLREKNPDLFEQACELDEELRRAKAGKMRSIPYLHSSLVPLREAVIKKPKRTAKVHAPDMFGNECFGMCGV